MKMSEFEYFEKLCVDYADSVYKMVWEQVLLLSIYTRQQLMEQDTILVESHVNFFHKLKLVELLWTERSEAEIEECKKEYEELREGILLRIEEYNDIHKITDYLTNISNNSKSKTSSDLAKSFLMKIAERHISFSGRELFTHHKHFYSYYAMYRSLTESVSVFRKILELDFSEKRISDLILHDIKNQHGLHNPLDQVRDTDNFKSSLKSANNLKQAFGIMAQYSHSIDFEPIIKKAHSALARQMGADIYGVFSVFQKSIITKGEYSKTPVSLFEQMVTFDDTPDELVLKIDRKLLGKYELLGKLDGVMDAIRRKISRDSTPVSPREEYTHPSTDRSSLLDVANWYNQVRTPIFIRVTDCPSLVASIFEFDFRMRIGLFTNLPFEKKTWFSKDGYLMITAIISLFLYQNNPVSKLYNQHSDILYDKNDSYIKNLTKYVHEELCPLQSQFDQDDANILKNRVMEDWANLTFDENLTEKSSQYIAMINRFKRLPTYLKPEKKIDKPQKNTLNTHGNQKSRIWDTRQLIYAQIEKSKKESYPIDSSFPLPLWS